MPDAAVKRRPNALKVLRDNVEEKKADVIQAAMDWMTLSPEDTADLVAACRALDAARDLLARAEGGV